MQETRVSTLHNQKVKKQKKDPFISKCDGDNETFIQRIKAPYYILRPRR